MLKQKLTTLFSMRMAITIPFLNEEQYILKTLNSLLYKTYIRDTFFVLVNNNSTDNSQEVIKSFVKNNPEINLIYKNEPKQGVFFARKKALDIALDLDVDIIIGTDADTVFNNKAFGDIIEFSFDTIHDVLSGRGTISPQKRLYRYLYFPYFVKLSSLLWNKEFEIFGNYFFGAFFAIKTKFYNKLSPFYYGKLLLVNGGGEDLLLSRRAYYLGGNFTESKNRVITSHRRFFSDPIGWLTAQRKGSPREERRRLNEETISYIRTNQEILAEKRIENVLDRWFRTAIDADNFYKTTGRSYKRAKTVVEKFCDFLKIPYSEFDLRNQSQYNLLRKLKQKHGKKSYKKVIEYVKSNLKNNDQIQRN